MPNYTDKQLLELPTDGFTIEQIARRGILIDMRAKEVALEKTEFETATWKDQRAAKARQDRQFRLMTEQQHAEDERIKKVCKHKTGGMDRKNFFNGSGDIYGYCISKQILPNGIPYAMCFRCLAQFFHPKHVQRYFPGHGEELISLKKAVTMGIFPHDEYLAMEKEFNFYISCEARTMDDGSGEQKGGHMFLVHDMETRLQQEHKEYLEYLGKLPKSEQRKAAMSA
jgi:hypothetical protein